VIGFHAKPNPEGISPYNLGSPMLAWNHLYVNHGTIFFLSESFGAPTVSSSLSVEDDPDGSSRFVIGTKEPGSTTKNIVISDKGISCSYKCFICFNMLHLLKMHKPLHILVVQYQMQ
jgi:hypothetical protein